MKVETEVSPEVLAQHPDRSSEIVEVKATRKWVHPECVPVEEVRG